jgi:hypothetical protein
MVNVREQVSYLSSITTTNYLSFLPNSGEEYIINNILTEDIGQLEFYKVSGGSAIVGDIWTTVGKSMDGLQLHNTTSYYWRVKNTHANTKLMSATGVCTRSSNAGYYSAIQNMSLDMALNGTWDLRPSSGVEWTIHNIIAEDAIQLIYTNGTNSITWKNFSNPNQAILGLNLRCNNSRWWQIKSLAATKDVGIDGIITKTG